MPFPGNDGQASRVKTFDVLPHIGMQLHHLKRGVQIMRKLLCVAALFGGFLLPVARTQAGERRHDYYRYDHYHHRHHHRYYSHDRYYRRYR
jgi:hypothetical protein